MKADTGLDIGRRVNCPDCGQPMLPKGKEKLPNEYDHASGCEREPEPKEKGWYWVLTAVQKTLNVRYFSGKHWRMHPGEVRPIRAPFKVVRRIKEPQVL